MGALLGGDGVEGSTCRRFPEATVASSPSSRSVSGLLALLKSSISLICSWRISSFESGMRYFRIWQNAQGPNERLEATPAREAAHTHSLGCTGCNN